jgi:hypothetical protein
MVLQRTDTEDRHTPIIDVINVTRCEFWERYDKHFSAFETERKRTADSTGLEFQGEVIADARSQPEIPHDDKE